MGVVNGHPLATNRHPLEGPGCLLLVFPWLKTPPPSAPGSSSFPTTLEGPVTRSVGPFKAKFDPFGGSAFSD